MRRARRHPAAKAMLQQALEIALPREALRLLLPLGREQLGMLQRAASGNDARIGGWHKRLTAIWARAHDTRPRLTPRELAILREVMEHKPSKQIARALGIAPETVKSHLKAIFAKCGAASRAELRCKASALATADSPAAPHPCAESAGSRALGGCVAV